MAKLVRLMVLLLIAFTLAGSPAWAERVMVPMRDGVNLATDYFLPQGEGPFPVVVTRSVYGLKSAPMVAIQLTPMGIALVAQDTRGRGDSEGKDQVFADDGWGERQDGADTVEWVLKQPWCNGTVGTWGMSALGITQVLMAGATQQVKAQSIIVAASNFYDQLAYQGGVFRKALCEGWTKGQGNSYIVEEWHKHPTYDDFWKQYNAEAIASRITAPALHVGGWWDIFAKGTLNNFLSRQYQGGEGAKGNQRLIMGPWVHGPVQKVGDLTLPKNFNYDFGKQEKRLYEYWLKGVDNGLMNEPPITYYTIGDVEKEGGPGNEWRTADQWPPFETVATNYYLGPNGALSTTEPAEGVEPLVYAYDPKNPCPTKGGQNLLIPAGPFDQREVSSRTDVLKFATEPLAEPLEITGEVLVKLNVSTDAPDTDFTAKLIDIYPDGREILMLDNIQRLKFRNGFEKAEPLPAGEIGTLTIDLWSISLIFDAGHRIGVQISSSNYPRFELNPNSGDDFPTEDNMRTANNKVHLDKAHPSMVVLPIRPKG